MERVYEAQTDLSVAAVQAVCRETAEPSRVRRGAIVTDTNRRFGQAAADIATLRNDVECARGMGARELRVRARNPAGTYLWIAITLVSAGPAGPAGDTADA